MVGEFSHSLTVFVHFNGFIPLALFIAWKK